MEDVSFLKYILNKMEEENFQNFESFLGFEDKSGQDSQLALFLENKLFELFRLFGFAQIDIAVLEKKDFFTEKYVGDSPWPGWNEKSLFEVDILNYSENYKKIEKIEKGVLVPEGTVSVCRWLSNQIIKKGLDVNKAFPLKLYYRAKCFRNEPIPELSQIRKREFLQIGLEFFGTTNEMADVETLYLMVRGVEIFGIPRNKIVIRIGDVRLFNQLIKLCNIKRPDEIVLKEKLDKLAGLKVLKNEKEIIQLQGEIEAYLGKIGVTDSYLKLWRILYSSDTPRLEEGISIITSYFGNKDVANSFYRIGEMLNFFGIPFKIDLCTIRGQEYYAGPVFEMDIQNGNNIYLKIAGGGRYNQLISKFLRTDNVSIPATGFAYGLERLLNAVKNEGAKRYNSSVKYFLDGKNLDYVIFPTDIKKAWKTAEKMRRTGRRIDLYCSDNNRENAKEYAKREGAIFLEV